jgi:hypothetical protein
MDNLNKELSFFRILRDNKNLIESDHLDSQFKLIVDYINNEIIENINNFIPEIYQGTVGNENYLLANNGDGTVNWKQFNEIIQDYSIDLKKIKKPNLKNNVLYINNDQELAISDAVMQDSMVLSMKNFIPVFKLIESENIEDEAIIGDDIADNTIQEENLIQELIDSLNGDVEDENRNINILQNANSESVYSIIVNNLIKEKTFINTKPFGVIDDDFLFPKNWEYDDDKYDLIEDGAITDNLIEWTQGQSAFGTGLTYKYFKELRCITSRVINDKAISKDFNSKNFFKNYFSIYKNIIDFNKFSPNFQIIREHFTNTDQGENLYAFDKSCFDKEVADAFTRKGC